MYMCDLWASIPSILLANSPSKIQIASQLFSNTSKYTTPFMPPPRRCYVAQLVLPWHEKISAVPINVISMDLIRRQVMIKVNFPNLNRMYPNNRTGLQKSVFFPYPTNLSLLISLCHTHHVSNHNLNLKKTIYRGVSALNRDKDVIMLIVPPFSFLSPSFCDWLHHGAQKAI